MVAGRWWPVYGQGPVFALRATLPQAEQTGNGAKGRVHGPESLRQRAWGKGHGIESGEHGAGSMGQSAESMAHRVIAELRNRRVDVRKKIAICYSLLVISKRLPSAGCR